jgi:hypothetical protein
MQLFFSQSADTSKIYVQTENKGDDPHFCGGRSTLSKFERTIKIQHPQRDRIQVR